jgi:hypothetical protein
MVENAYRQVEFDLGDGRGRVRLRHGFARMAGADEQCYVIESDFFFGGRTEVGDGERILDYFHEQAGYLFHWCITPRLVAALRPSYVV